jgi:pimeloyl-ACP methyl ester carboxylesterase
MATPATATDHFVEANGLRIHYLDWGSPTAPPLVMLHGLRGYAHGWDGVARELCDRWHVLALDQRGRGESDWDPEANYTTDPYVSDFEQLVEQMRLDRFVLMGHSMGGANTLIYTARHPERVRAVVIEDMGPRPDPPPPGYARIGEELQATPMDFGSWAEAEAFWRGQRASISAEAMADRLRNTLKELPDGRIGWRYDLQGIRRSWGRPGGVGQLDLWPPVRGLRCPTLVLRGALSDILARETAQAMADANPNVRWVEIPGATHFVHDDNLEAFNREVAQFLDHLD